MLSSLRLSAFTFFCPAGPDLTKYSLFFCSVRDRRQDFIERHPGRAYAHHKAYIGHRKQIDQLDRAAIAAENDAMNHFVHARRGGYY